MHQRHCASPSVGRRRRQGSGSRCRLAAVGVRQSPIIVGATYHKCVGPLNSGVLASLTAAAAALESDDGRIKRLRAVPAACDGMQAGRTGRVITRADRVITRAGRVIIRAGRVIIRTDKVITRAGRVIILADKVIIRADRMIIRAGMVIIWAGRVITQAG